MGTYKHNNAEHKVSWLSFTLLWYPFEPLNIRVCESNLC